MNLKLFLMFALPLSFASPPEHTKVGEEAQDGVVGFNVFYYACSPDQQEIMVYSCNPKKMKSIMNSLADCSPESGPLKVVNIEKFKYEYFEKIRSGLLPSIELTQHEKEILKDKPEETLTKITSHIDKLEAGINNIRNYIAKLKLTIDINEKSGINQDDNKKYLKHYEQTLTSFELTKNKRANDKSNQGAYNRVVRKLTSQIKERVQTICNGKGQRVDPQLNPELHTLINEIYNPNSGTCGLSGKILERVKDCDAMNTLEETTHDTTFQLASAYKDESGKTKKIYYDKNSKKTWTPETDEMYTWSDAKLFCACLRPERVRCSVEGGHEKAQKKFGKDYQIKYLGPLIDSEINGFRLPVQDIEMGLPSSGQISDYLEAGGNPKDEQMLGYNKKLATIMKPTTYWSTSNVSYFNARSFHGQDGSLFSDAKNVARPVRCVGGYD